MRKGHLFWSLIFLPSFAISQTSFDTTFEGKTSQRVVFSIHGEVEWSVETEKTSLRIFTQEGIAEILMHLPHNFDKIDGVEIIRAKGDSDEHFNFSCNCQITIYRYNENYLIVDISQENPNAPGRTLEGREDLRNAPRWWEASSFTSKQIIFSESILEDGINRMRPIPGLGKFDSGLVLENSFSEHQGDSTLSHVEATIEKQIGVNVPDGSTMREHKVKDRCPLQELYEHEEGRLGNSRGDLITEVRKEMDNANGERDSQEILNHTNYFLQLGFVPEAVQLLTLVDGSELERVILESVFRILNGEIGVTFGTLESEICSGLLDVWYFTTGSNEYSGRLSESLAILQFKALPSRIREEIFVQFASSLLSPTSTAEVISFMEEAALAQKGAATSTTQPLGQTESLLLQINRIHPEKMPELFEISDELSSTNLVDLSEAIRSEHRGTDLWIDLMSAEIQYEIENYNIGSTVSKVNQLISSGAPQLFVAPLMDSLLEVMLAETTPTELLSLHFSENLRNWPQHYRGKITNHLANQGFSYLTNGDEKIRQGAGILPGYVTGPNQLMLSFDTIDQLSSPQIQKTLRQSEQFKQELVRNIISE